MLIKFIASLLLSMAYTAGVVALSSPLGYWTVLVGPIGLLAISFAIVAATSKE